MGPIYCETSSIITAFPIEPINTWSNLVIVALGVLAFVLVVKRPVKREGRTLWLLAALLVMTGLGSFLWHGWRTPVFLALDALPGGLFLLTCVYVWLRRFYSGWLTFFIFAGFVVLEGLSITYGGQILRSNLIFVSTAPVIIVLGAWLISRTYLESLRAAAIGGGAILFALIALAFRSIDLALCPSFPIGTHFLWHIFLSLAALLIILMFIVIDYSRASLRPSRLLSRRASRTSLHM